MAEKIYSWRARRTGASATGRIKATDHRDATRQVIQYLSTFGPGYKVEVTELKNQKLAMRKWLEDHSERNDAGMYRTRESER